MSSKHKGSSAWDRASLYYRDRHPLCAACEANGKSTPATCVDHIVPHKGDRGLLWDSNNWQSLCDHCHNSIKKAQEMRAQKQPKYDIDGYPIDKTHRCYREGIDTKKQKPGGEGETK